ncbi:unnamed protein product, partial [Phaeothamnion confervicola]
ITVCNGREKRVALRSPCDRASPRQRPSPAFLMENALLRELNHTKRCSKDLAFVHAQLSCKVTGLRRRIEHFKRVKSEAYAAHALSTTRLQASIQAMEVQRLRERLATRGAESTVAPPPKVVPAELPRIQPQTSASSAAEEKRDNGGRRGQSPHAGNTDGGRMTVSGGVVAKRGSHPSPRRVGKGRLTVAASPPQQSLLQQQPSSLPARSLPLPSALLQPPLRPPLDAERHSPAADHRLTRGNEGESGAGGWRSNDGSRAPLLAVESGGLYWQRMAPPSPPLSTQPGPLSSSPPSSPLRLHQDTSLPVPAARQSERPAIAPLQASPQDECAVLAGTTKVILALAAWQHRRVARAFYAWLDAPRLGTAPLP